MCNRIMLEENLSKQLEKHPGVLEIYADPEYQLGDAGATLIILHQGDKQDHMLYLGFNQYMNCKLVFVTDMFSHMFTGRRIIYRKGKWYL